MAEDLSRIARLLARTAPEMMVLVRRAAELQGCDVETFVTHAVRVAAEDAIEATHIIRLAHADQDRLVTLLLEPPPLSPAIERARAAHGQLLRGRSR